MAALMNISQHKHLYSIWTYKPSCKIHIQFSLPYRCYQFRFFSHHLFKAISSKYIYCPTKDRRIWDEVLLCLPSLLERDNLSSYVAKPPKLTHSESSRHFYACWEMKDRCYCYSCSYALFTQGQHR